MSPGLLGEDDEDRLYELSISMFPEDGCLHVYGVAEVAATAFTPCGIEHPNRVPRRDRLPCGAHRMLTTKRPIKTEHGYALRLANKRGQKGQGR